MSQLHKAYVDLTVAAKNEDGTRSVPIKRFGTFEVRLVDFSTDRSADSFDIWIELYSHATQSSLDSYLCHDLDEAEPMLEHLISSARDLNESPLVAE